MPVIDCPIADCEYATPDVDAIVEAALITTHATIHNTAASTAAIAKGWKSQTTNHILCRHISYPDGLIMLRPPSFLVRTKLFNYDDSVDYTEAVLRDMFSRGLDDSEIYLDLLGDKNQEMTLEEVFKFVEAKESGRRSASRLLDIHTHGAEAASSSYKRQVNDSLKDRNRREQKYTDKHELCSYCGKKGHGIRSSPHIRKKQCALWNQPPLWQYV